MTKKELLNEYYYEKLTKSHDLSNFSCGVKDLDAFLKEDALIQQEKKLNVTYLAIRKNEILGFISISADNIRCRDINKKLKSIYPNYPAVKIGRFGVSEKYQGIGLGSDILETIQKIIIKMSKKLGISYITIDAYCSARKFYLKHSFNQKMKDYEKLRKKGVKENDTILMYKHIKKI
ncbi:MAG: GNAT family N-acetyltransferase [Methanobrevibacter sp.]|nr:GNAT family N-acetyltransferase [Methanobrevibacter sp.]